MNYIVKSVLLVYFTIEMITSNVFAYEHFIILLAIIAITILKEKLIDSNYLTIVVLLLIGAGTAMDLKFIVLFGLPVYDFMIKRSYWGVVVTGMSITYFSFDHYESVNPLALIVLCGLFAYTQQVSHQEQRQWMNSLDNERRLRYELEQTKLRLLQSSKEIASITEVKERNRIARDIHDSVGHNISGILIQLRAAYKLHAKDESKSLELVSQSIEGLASSIELLRDTVHNIKPQEIVGVEHVKKIVDNFSFCPVQLKLNGDFNTIPANHIEILIANVKEALTNSSRYSKATCIEIAIDINERYSRLYVKDNGVGCAVMKEGLGLSGMKERVRNLGGTVSVSSDDGFLIVCVIPRQEKEEIA
ncbi:MAG: sensor histidine kinase [Candidatus Cohnella colombiensis]|uniref:histidine kinase n=1 Tax=Candidatus Cohnella colombiensis TaxID=3121368 RepID=A0AA95F6C3_9BACL|nr:MAG: sensor histidine kinase [Cohnella sp.]